MSKGFLCKIFESKVNSRKKTPIELVLFQLGFFIIEGCRAFDALPCALSAFPVNFQKLQITMPILQCITTCLQTSREFLQLKTFLYFCRN